jgi:CPA2 family monovalent cation:H+ antiporter-2
MGDILPLRDAFVSIFFVSLGMLFDVRVVAAQPLVVGALLFGFLVAKGALATLAAMAMRFPARVAWLAGVGLAQFGEFGFVLTRLARSSGVLDDAATGPLLAAGIGSMFLTPLLVRAAPHVTAGERLLAPLERLLGVRSIDEADEGHTLLQGHVVVVGFGLAGRLAAESLQACGERFVVIELNANLVRQGKTLGLPVYYGDATSEEALRHAHLENARLVVLLMNDPQAARRVVDTVKRVAPHVAIHMRTRYLGEHPGLAKLGANDVVAEEVEGAVEVVARMLRALDAPRNQIDERIRAIRAATQTTARTATVPRKRLGDTRGLDELTIESARVEPGSAAAHTSVVELRLRSETGALVVGVRRGDTLLARPDPTVPLQPGDVAYLVGTGEALTEALRRFTAGDHEPDPRSMR